MIKKYLPRIFIIVGGYILFRFPAGLLEDWIIGKVEKQMETNGISFFILWVLPLLGAIGLLAIVGWVWGFIKEIQIKARDEYQPRSPTAIIGMVGSVSLLHGETGGLKWHFNTNDKKDYLLEAPVPIQSVRFTKPTDIIIKRDALLPIMVDCESNPLKRIRNKIFSVPKPQISVKRFTEKGIIFDEENTDGTDISLEFYPK